MKEGRKGILWEEGGPLLSYGGEGVEEYSDNIFRTKPGTPDTPPSPVGQKTLGLGALLFSMVLALWRNGFSRNILTEYSAKSLALLVLAGYNCGIRDRGWRAGGM